MGRASFLPERFEHKPLYEKLAGEFCRRITMGRWPVGKPLKTEAIIASELGVSLGTVRKAFERLEAMHLIDRTPGRGTIVREFDCERRLASLTSVLDLQGRPVRGEIAIGSVQRVEASGDVAHFLDVAPGVSLLRVERTRAHHGQQFAIETAYIHLIPGDLDIEADSLWSFARNLVVHGEIAVGRIEYARACVLSGEEPAVWFEDSPDPVLEVHRVLHAFEERPIEYCLSYLQLGEHLRYRVC